MWFGALVRCWNRLLRACLRIDCSATTSPAPAYRSRPEPRCCQGFFSEPGAGSYLSGAANQGVDMADHWLVKRQAR